MENKNLGWKIFGLFVSIFLIIGGLSGELVLRGTESSGALVVVGFLFLAWDIYALATHKKQQSEVEENVELTTDSLSQDASQPETEAHLVHNQLQDDVIKQALVPLPPPPKYNGIQWFFKALKHYADFSGRARRKEFWMFVLYNLIFYFAWAFLMAFIFVLTNGEPDNLSIALFCYLFLMMLPAMAVAVRRLHDTGKSGWMMLVALIPFVGGIWLLVLMLTDGQQRENKYGPNPKVSEVPFDEPARLKNAGLTLIVAASAWILIIFVNVILYVINDVHFNYGMTFFNFVVNAFLLTVGIYLLKEKKIYGMQEKRKSVMILLAAASISVLLSIWGLIGNIRHLEFWGWQHIVNSLIYIILYFSIAVFAASVLFSPQNKNLVRNAAIMTIVFSGLVLLLKAYFSMNGTQGHEWNQIINLLGVFHILTPVAYIVLAGTYLSGKDQFVPNSVSATACSNNSVHTKGMSSVPEVTKKPQIVLIHKVGSMYHKIGEEQEITGNYAEIGREPKCQVRYDEHFETVSRRHATIMKDDNQWKLLPLSRTNPTFVNGQMVQKEWYLQHGDEIQCAVNGPKLAFKLSTNSL